ncbi:MAPEG family protein [Methyloligella solikamskensis]|uniref:MAPEG family protein n=1 Tax=Methyloligella solikamskensis TaxID=1177756 RepID=A0ABW3J8C0_9HYPH
MTTPLYVLVLYALWTIAVLFAGVATARARRVMKGEKFSDFPGGVAEGPSYHQRAMRAHLNCVENLPVYAAVAITAAIAGVTGPVISALAITVLVFRIAQSSLHLSFEQTEKVVRIRGSLFGIQILAIIWMALIVLIYA